ncbi:histidine kinase [Saxibacter everestensis]|uniref:histidine kinase n=1 Tax=Saxibacter everestensis TaxID=2909229 RepID=A0ABY8QVK8_9MICO|nr:histidine kinase [Brevibacteriaceae bacterium ZFBP1038]
MRKRERIYLWLREHPILIDSIFVAGPLTLLSLLFIGVNTFPLWPLTLLLTLGMTVPLALRRTQPVLSGGIVASSALLYCVLGIIPVTNIIAVPLSVYALTAYAPRRAGRAGLIAGLAGSALFGLRYGPMMDTGSLLFSLITGAFLALMCASLVLVSWTLGDLTRVRRQQLADLAERNRLLEIERDQEARLAANAERSRIAREMHDVVAHSLSVVIAQADGGRYAAATDPKAAAEVLETISSTGRAALADMRRLLGVLREGADDIDTRPQPGIVDLPELVDAVRAAGLPVSYEIRGPQVELPAGPALAIYRIVQESLTNTMKHGGPEVSSRVLLDFAPNGVVVTVQDDGRGAGADPVDGRGHGIVGMNERATLYGGTFSAGPHPGGYLVTAFFPYMIPTSG